MKYLFIIINFETTYWIHFCILIKRPPKDQELSRITNEADPENDVKRSLLETPPGRH